MNINELIENSPYNKKTLCYIKHKNKNILNDEKKNDISTIL